MRNHPFHYRQFNPNTYIIDEHGCYMYLLLGQEKALLIDSGVVDDDLRACVETLTSLPVEVVCTHGHIDHVAGNPYFDQVFLHKNAADDVETSYRAYKERGRTGNFAVHYIDEGHQFQLGGRTVEVIAIHCHSKGDIALLDKENRMLFTGDNLEAGQVLLFYGDGEVGATVARHLEIMEKLKAREAEYDVICPAHNGSPLDKSYVDRFIENDKLVLGGQEGAADLYSPTFQDNGTWDIHEEFVRCSWHKGTAIVYDTRRVHTSKGLYSFSEY